MDLRKIDAMITEKVMGLGVLQETVDEFSVYNLIGEFADARPLPRYSSDIAAAWEVVEKLRSAPDFVFTLVDSSHTVGHSTEWYCMVGYTRAGFDFSKAGAGANTAPLAICLAALEAGGIDVSREERTEVPE